MDRLYHINGAKKMAKKVAKLGSRTGKKLAAHGGISNPSAVQGVIRRAKLGGNTGRKRASKKY